MTTGGEAVMKVVPRIADIPSDVWDRLANPDPATHDPFVSHAFLKALEDARTVGRRAGWLPCHLVLEQGGVITAAMPNYLKSHSKGEYIFDYGWAEAYERAGGRYYPKLQCAVPFTPVPGRRLLVGTDDGAEQRERLLLAGAIELTQQQDASSLHLTFLTEGEWQRAGASGLLQRTDQQFHWQNDGYATFDDFLGSLASRKRKGIRRERLEALAAGLTIEQVRGAEITEAHWDAFFRFYVDTGNRKWGHPYLNREFFSYLGAAMADRCLLIMVRHSDRYIAGALNMVGGDCLYGRYWGAIEHHPCLHFEVCYYQAIDYAISHGLRRVEAGAQGEHKLARGYMPTPTYSVHWIADPALRRAVDRYLTEERRHMAHQREALAQYGPYRKVSADDLE
jgi:predicted N-acyltransferase